MFDRLLTIEEVSEQLQLRPKTIHQLVRDKELSCVQLTPRERRFLPEQIQAFIESRTIQVPKSVDTAVPQHLPFYPKALMKGGKEKSEGNSVRAQIREELRQW